MPSTLLETDPTEGIRRQMLHEINEPLREKTDEEVREELEAKHGKVYSTNEMCEAFEVEGFMAPLVVVRRRSDGQKGSLCFANHPRFYFCFESYNRV